MVFGVRHKATALVVDLPPLGCSSVMGANLTGVPIIKPFGDSLLLLAFTIEA